MEQPTTITLSGLPLHCPHCQHTRFFERNWQLNTSGMSFFDLDWLNRSAKNFVCARCGRIEWFTEVPAGEGDAGDIECLECGTSIPHGQTQCAKCGWSYQ
jgi:predicted nucleic-acid-binding Zn-ribbon protein